MLTAHAKGKQSASRKQVGINIAGEIENSAKPIKRPITMSIKQKSKYSSGKCIICGKTFDMITNTHAVSHGFSSANEMAQSDKVRFVNWK